MESPILDRPKVKVTPKITKISSLAQSAEEIKKTSTKLRKTFESGSYQKKTQLTVLNRYKKKLDSIQKQNDKKFSKKQRVKIKLPQIKKFAGSFFSAGSDPLKTLAALAAFNALNKGVKGDILGALGPALVFGGLAFGPSLAKFGLKSFVKGGGASAAGGGVPNLPPAWWQKNPKSLGRANESYARYIAGEANIGDRARLGRRGLISASGMFSRGGTEALERQAGKPLAKQALGRFGKSIIPGAGAAFSFYSAKERYTSGDKFGSAIDNIAGSLDAFAAGVQIAAATAAASGIGLPAAGVIELAAGIASIGSFSLDMFNLFRDLTGQSDKEAQKNKLEQKTEEQKKLVEKKKGSALTFGKTLDRYERVVNKFEEFSKNFTLERKTEGFMENIPPRTPTPITDPYTGPISGETFIPLPGATSIGDPGQGQNYGAPRGGRPHEGIDLTELRQQDSRAPIVAYKTGKVIKVETGDIYPGGGIEIDHGGGLITRYLHVTPSVSVGNVVYGGQQIGNLFRYYRGNQEQTHLHFEVYQDNQLMNPTSYVTGVKNKITSPLDPARAKQHHESATKISPAVSPTPGSASPAPTPSSPPAASPPRVVPPARPSRSISQFTSYDPRGQMQQVIPVTIPIPQQQMMQAGSSESIMLPGPSEQDLLNSFYKRVLLNTVA